MSWREQQEGAPILDDERRATLEILTGRNSSKKTYYPALRRKLEELEVSNAALGAAREQAEALALELQRAASRTSSVLEATRHISRHLGLEEVVGETVRVVTDSLGYPWAAIHVFRDPPHQSDLLVETHAGTAPPFLGGDVGQELHALPGFIEAREGGEVVVTPAPGFEDAALVFLPLRSERRTLAVLTVAADELRPDDLEVLQGVGQALALAVENAALYRRVTRQARRLDRSLESLGSISSTLTLTTHGVEVFLDELVTTVRGLTGARQVFVLTRESSSGVSPDLTPLWWTGFGASSPAGTLVSRVMSELLPALEPHAEPVWLDADLVRRFRGNGWPRDEGTELVRALCIPMRRGGLLTGAIIAFFSTIRGLEPAELEALRILGNQTAVSLENAYLYEKAELLRRRAEQAYEEALDQKRETERKHAELQRALIKISEIEKTQILQEERARIARELHDTAAQVLYSIGLGLDWCRRHTEEGELRERLDGLHRLAGECVKEIRQSIFDLAPANVTDFGLLDAVRRLANEYPKLTAIRLQLDIPDRLPEMSLRRENEIYRILQEALFNAYKHSQARSVLVRLAEVDHEVSLTIADDGVGMAQAQMRGYLPRRPRFGLRGMRERAESLGGYVTVESEPGMGTRVVARIPTRGCSGNGGDPSND